MNLSDDEFTVLLIAAEGQSMMPIGRWQAPVEALTERGLLAGDKFNRRITAFGLQALKDRDKQDDKAYTQILELGTQVANGRQQYQQFMEQAAQALANAAKAAHTTTGDSPQHAIEQSLPVLRTRALELIPPTPMQQKMIAEFRKAKE